MRFTKPTKVIGLDIGSHSVKAVLMTKPGGKLRIESIGYAPVDRAQSNVDPTVASATAIREALRSMPVSQCLLVGALPGQTAVIRYPRLRDVSLDAIDQAVEAEASQNIPYDMAEVFLDWSLLEEEGDEESHQMKVILVAAKHEVIDARVQLANAAEIEYGVLSVDSLALSDAAEGCDFLRVGESVALINIGASSVSIHFIKDGISNFIRDISWGATEMIQAIAKARHCDFDEAERVLIGAEEELRQLAPPPPPPPEPEPEAVAVEEVVADPLSDDDVIDEVPSVDPLAMDDPLAEIEASGGGSDSLLDPLDDELEIMGSAMPEPASATPGQAAAGAAAQAPAEDTIADMLSLPISRLVAEIRRSFDYYEHQLYERPVERVILSGGVAHLSLFRSALVEDLGIEEVEVANPAAGAINVRRSRSVQFDEHPAQFMVAVGLAARGAAEL